ncbi:MAG TPA: RecQ family ATP-dependent DNA helicase [Candidatus Binatia bacterium]|nr:RecQ family ATP-dependent DNA helicase [Candidatus Binatia bacterium]
MAAPSANGAPAPRGPGRNHRRRRRRRQQGPIPFRPRPAHPADGEDQLDLGPAEDPSAPLTPVAAAARRIGIRRLHPEQQRAIEAALAGRNVLMVLPTGFGKSAAYQIPSMLLPKPVVLISPLLALLKDQHEKLIKFDVPCVRLDGTVRGKARVAALERIRKGGSLLVMTTPETLGSEEASSALRESGISLAAIDEAHCISEWGYDFRPAYLQIGDRLRALGAPPVMALTATATEKVRADVVRFLGMREAEIVSSSPHRSNLAFEVIECREAARARALARLAQRLRRPGIIYCTTTREVDTVFAILSRLGIPAHRYHGKMAAGERNAQQELFMKPGRRTVMVATNAFGLGIDKPDIRYVVHGQSPASLEQYVQEAGRAGRDGAKANCILLFDPDDRQTHEALLARSRLRPDQLYRLGSALAAWAAEGRTPTVDALALSADLGERPTNALLVPIEEAGIVRTRDDGTVETLVPAEEVEERVRSLAGQFATMRTQDSRRLDSVADYSHTPECRAVFLRAYFGEEDGEPCNLCDICRGRPERPSTFWQPVAAPPRPGKKRKRGRRGPQIAAYGGRSRGRGNGAGGEHAQQARHRRPNQQHQAQQPQGGKPGGRSQRRRRGRRRRGRPDQPPPMTPTPTPAP